MKMTPKQRLERSHHQLMSHEYYKFFAASGMSGNVHITGDVSTGATDGFDCYYNPDFIASMPDPELRFLNVHEWRHILFSHVSVWERLIKKDAMLANMAMDYVINLQIVDEDKPHGFLAIPTWKDGPKVGQVMGLIDEKFRGMDTTQVFNILWDENEQGKQDNPTGSGDESGEDGDSTESSSNQPPTGKPTGGEYSQATLDRLKEQLDEHKFDEVIDKMSKEEKEEKHGIATDAIRSATQLYGDCLTNAQKQNIGASMETDVAWEDELKEFVTTHNKDAQIPHWKRCNKRLLGSGIHMPSYYGESSGHIAKYDDMSGSISTVAQQRSLGALLEIADVTKPSGLHISYWDTKICSEESYTPDEYDSIADTTEPMGGGGTDPNCIVHDVVEKLDTGVYSEGLECVIIITDGWFYSELDEAWSTLEVPVLWCIDNFEGYANVDFEPPCGTKLIMKEQ